MEMRNLDGQAAEWRCHAIDVPGHNADSTVGLARCEILIDPRLLSGRVYVVLVHNAIRKGPHAEMRNLNMSVLY